MCQLNKFKNIILWICVLVFASICNSVVVAEPKKPLTAQLETVAQSAILMDGMMNCGAPMELSRILKS